MHALLLGCHIALRAIILQQEDLISDGERGGGDHRIPLGRSAGVPDLMLLASDCSRPAMALPASSTRSVAPSRALCEGGKC